MTSLDLKAARTQLGYTQATLAERLKVSPNTVARWEQPKGGFPIPEYVPMILAVWLETPPRKEQP